MIIILGSLLGVAIIVGLFMWLISIFNTSGPERTCLDCGRVGRSKKLMPGSVALEGFLYLCLVLPGLIYSIWRISSKTYVCPNCESRRLAKEIIKKVVA